MHIKILSTKEFEKFVALHPLSNPYQSLSYAHFMQKRGYTYELLGYVDTNNKIYAASLILRKRIFFLFQYGYAPRGFLLDYFDKKLFQKFTEDIKTYYKKRHFIFLKINPAIAIAQIDNQDYKKTYNQNIEIKNNLLALHYTKLKDNLYFEAMLPTFNAILSLKDFSIKTLHKNTRNKIRRAEHKGLYFEVADIGGIDLLYPFVYKTKIDEMLYYKEYYTSFLPFHTMDLLLVSIEPLQYLEHAKNAYTKELKYNKKIADILTREDTRKNRNLKINSDILLLTYKNDLREAQKLVEEKTKIFIAGALVLKHKNRIQIVVSGYDTSYKQFNPNYFLHYNIFKHYKKYYDYADLNGITGNFGKSNPYHGLNTFKLGFKPNIYEFIGEYDLVILPTLYRFLLKSGYLAKKFNKKNSKKNEHS